MKIVPGFVFTRGWFVGDFEPSIYRTDKFEVGILHHKKGEVWPKHYHTAVEINYLISGKIKMHGVEIPSGHAFVLEPYEVADPEFLEDCVVVVIKSPSISGDKYIIDETS